MRVEAKISPRSALCGLVGKKLDSIELFKMINQEIRTCQMNADSVGSFCAFTQAHDIANYEAGILYFEKGRCDDPKLNRWSKIDINKKIIDVNLLSFDDGENYFESGVILRMQDDSEITLSASGFPYMIYVNINNIYSIGVPEYDISDYQRKAI